MSRISSISSRDRDPEDLIAIFHCSFHPTRGNIIDWSMKASEDLNLDGVEFSTLPSGLHLVDKDMVQTYSHPQPWLHLASRKELSRTLDERWSSLRSCFSDAEDTRHWTLLSDWYLRCVFRRVGKEGQWVDWDEELSSEFSSPSPAFTTPTANLGAFVSNIVHTHACTHPTRQPEPRATAADAPDGQAL
ncbi:hypothetical protein JB92DRAFT_3144230 [Gautieria morchelliformis]|nr:hypothetical protein JB92DRAFT_3144230 [Gautieria morchelliformis]